MTDQAQVADRRLPRHAGHGSCRSTGGPPGFRSRRGSPPRSLPTPPSYHI